MTITKLRLARHVAAKKRSVTRVVALEIINAVFEIMKDTLGEGESVRVSRFGNFVIAQKRPRMGRNPRTGEVFEISGRRVAKFKASPALTNAMNPNSQ